MPFLPLLLVYEFRADSSENKHDSPAQGITSLNRSRSRRAQASCITDRIASLPVHVRVLCSFVESPISSSRPRSSYIHGHLNEMKCRHRAKNNEELPERNVTVKNESSLRQMRCDCIREQTRSPRARDRFAQPEQIASNTGQLYPTRGCVWMKRNAHYQKSHHR